MNSDVVLAGVDLTAANVIVRNVSEMVSLFARAAQQDPLAAALLVIGNLLVVFSIAAFGYLTAGAAVDWIVPESIGRAPPPGE